MEISDACDDIDAIIHGLNSFAGELADSLSALQAQESHNQRLAETKKALERDKGELHTLAYHDGLTGLPNRALLSQRMKDSIRDSGRTGQTTAVIVVDLDGFKPVNDRHGHAAGDRVLQAVSERLLRCVRGVDTVSRTGGDEFVVLLNGVPESRIVNAVAHRIIETIQAPVLLDSGDEAMVTASLGVALFKAGLRGHELLQQADSAMYDAKRSGHGQVAFYGGEMRLPLDRRNLVPRRPGTTTRRLLRQWTTMARSIGAEGERQAS